VSSRTAYESPLRRRQAAETRQRIAHAALRLFLDRGYAATSVADIAREAEVAVQTIYAAFGAKRKIVLALVDAIDELAGFQPLVERLRAATDPHDVIRTYSAITRTFRQGDAGEIVRVLFVSAVSEPELLAAKEEGKRRHRGGAARAAERLETLGALAGGVTRDVAAATLATLTSQETYEQLRHEHGWDLETCETWIVASLERLLLAHPADRAAA
jgi:AcrR family transcriptional regulator